MVRIGILEDDIRSAALLKENIDRFSQQEKVDFSVVTFHEANALLEAGEAFDLLFMDIEMPGIDGFEEARRIRERDDKVSIIFVTNMVSYAPKGYSVNAMDFIVKPETKTGDGVGGRLPFGERPNACCYTGKVISDTWSPDLMTRRGELMGEESLYCGYTMVYSTGANLHRTPFGGRNFEYISEDGNFAYYAAYYEVAGMKSKGVNAAVKHFAANDQEFKRMGVATFFNEQAMRETTLRPFEGGIRKGKTHAFMQSYNRVGCTWSSANYALCISLVREEWGFEGAEITDAASTIDYAGRFQASITAGTDIYCIDSKGESGKQLVEAISENDDGTLLLALRRAVKANHFSAVNSCAINGLSVHSTVREIMPTWQYLAIAGIILFAVATATFFTLFVLSKHFWTSKEDREKEVRLILECRIRLKITYAMPSFIDENNRKTSLEWQEAFLAFSSNRSRRQER